MGLGVGETSSTAKTSGLGDVEALIVGEGLLDGVGVGLGVLFCAESVSEIVCSANVCSSIA